MGAARLLGAHERPRAVRDATDRAAAIALLAFATGVIVGLLFGSPA